MSQVTTVIKDLKREQKIRLYNALMLNSPKTMEDLP